MTKSELIAMLTGKQAHLLPQDIDLAVNSIIEALVSAISQGERIEIRGFGAFSVQRRTARLCRNPKTGGSISLPNRYAVRFKSGLDLSERVNGSRLSDTKIKEV